MSKSRRDGTVGRDTNVFICRHCGNELPCDYGQTPDNCSEWADQTLAKMPYQAPLSVILQMRTNARLCMLVSIILQDSALLDEAFGPQGKGKVLRT